MWLASQAWQKQRSSSALLMHVGGIGWLIEENTAARMAELPYEPKV